MSIYIQLSITLTKKKAENLERRQDNTNVLSEKRTQVSEGSLTGCVQGYPGHVDLSGVNKKSNVESESRIDSTPRV